MPLPHENLLREIPSIGELLATDELQALHREQGRDTVADWTRQAVESVRARLRADESGPPATRAAFASEVLRAVSAVARDESARRLGRVINATGVILHTSLGRAPLSAAAVAALREAAGACNLEVDLVSGERRSRGYQLSSAWRRLTGAEASLVVNNNAAATVLMLDALCRGHEVIISRGQLIEIGGSFRLPEIFAQSGAILREVGTTNRTTLADYERAIGPATAAILRVHTSNYRVIGFAESPLIDELSQLAGKAGVLCFDDIGSGCLVDTALFELPHEPTFTESIEAGADLVLGSGDKLLGGPQCGILLGRESLLVRLRNHPLARAVRIDKLTLAALSATLDAYLRGAATSEIPTLQLLAAPVESLVARARQFEHALADADRRTEDSAATQSTFTIAVDQETSPVGGGSLPGAALATAVLRLKHRAWSAAELARRLRLGNPRLFGRVRDDEVLLDLRSVLPEDDVEIVSVLRTLEVVRRET
jgi:L-seryl-tRNA(Ser) seleniumtransferase